MPCPSQKPERDYRAHAASRRAGPSPELVERRGATQPTGVHTDSAWTRRGVIGAVCICERVATICDGEETMLLAGRESLALL